MYLQGCFLLALHFFALRVLLFSITICAHNSIYVMGIFTISSATFLKFKSLIIVFTLSFRSFHVYDIGSRNNAEKMRFSLTVSVPTTTSSYNLYTLIKLYCLAQYNWLTWTTYADAHLKLWGCLFPFIRMFPDNPFLALRSANTSNSLKYKDYFLITTHCDNLTHHFNVVQGCAIF